MRLSPPRTQSRFSTHCQDLFSPPCLASRPSTNAMVATPMKPQRLSARDDDGGKGDWGPLQIATPAIVGGVLLLVFAVYLIWRRRPLRKRSYDYHKVRSDWVSRIERMFVPRRTRQRVLHSSAPITLDDSMRTSGLTLDFRRERQYRSGSSDSQTPLTAAGFAFDYPPKLSDSPPPIAKRRPFRWWWIFGSRPREIKSEEPDRRWHVDGPDGSSTGHGHSSQGHESSHAQYARVLEAVHEGQEEVEDDVIRIGEDFSSIALATPMTQHFPEQARAVRGMQTVSEHTESSRTRTPVPAVSAPRSNPGTPASSANRSLPPSYDVSQSHTFYASTEDIIRRARSEPYMIIPPPVRAAGYSSPRAFHGRELSSDSLLAAQPPMVATSMY